MPTYSGNEKPSIEDLEHYGVKGMKWGQRKSYSTADIKAARARLNEREKKYETAENHYTYGRNVSAKDERRNKQIDKRLEKLDKEYRDDPDRYIAARTTRGEKAVSVILGGPFGLAAIGAHAAAVRVGEKRQQKRLAGK